MKVWELRTTITGCFYLQGRKWRQLDRFKRPYRNLCTHSHVGPIPCLHRRFPKRVLWNIGVLWENFDSKPPHLTLTITLVIYSDVLHSLLNCVLYQPITFPAKRVLAGHTEGVMLHRQKSNNVWKSYVFCGITWWFLEWNINLHWRILLHYLPGHF